MDPAHKSQAKMASSMSTTRAAAAMLLLLPMPSLVPTVGATATEYLEPNVKRVVGVLPPGVCRELIRLGEESGFLVQDESIDVDEQNDPNQRYVPSQTIDVYTRGWNEPDLEPLGAAEHAVSVGHEAIWDYLRPHVPRIRQIVVDNRDAGEFAKLYPDEPNREPELNWVFFRKYSPNDERNSLKQHVDTNMNTVNIELSNDYEGGGLFYIKPLAETGSIADEHYEGGYDHVNSIKRRNTTDVVFPQLGAGDAIFYNYTVRHGVAPVESGTRYSMAFFFDMDNPAVVSHHVFEVDVKNSLPDTDLDIVLVYDGGIEEETWEVLFEKVGPGEVATYHRANIGDLIQVMVAGTYELVHGIELTREETLYEVTSRGDPNEFPVKLNNQLEPGVSLDFVKVYDAHKEQGGLWEKVVVGLQHGETITRLAYGGDMLLAVVTGTDRVVSAIEMRRHRTLYSVSQVENTSDSAKKESKKTLGSEGFNPAETTAAMSSK